MSWTLIYFWKANFIVQGDLNVPQNFSFLFFLSGKQTYLPENVKTIIFKCFALQKNIERMPWKRPNFHAKTRTRSGLMWIRHLTGNCLGILLDRKAKSNCFYVDERIFIIVMYLCNYINRLVSLIWLFLSTQIILTAILRFNFLTQKGHI